MRGAILMCLFVICAALSMHYVQLGKAERESGRRSDPLVAFDHAFRASDDDDLPATQPILSVQAAPSVTSINDFEK